MEDRFLFRAWLPELKKMVYPKAIHYVEKGIAIEYDDDVASPGWFELMQCTGLKDKDGRLIFEGDIVRGQNRYEISEIVLRDGVWMMKMFLGHRPALWEIDPIEVIGNRWENPELLKKGVKK